MTRPSDEDLRARLERAAVPGADDARTRARDEVMTAFAARRPRPRRRRRAGAAILVGATALALAAATAPGAAVADWVVLLVGAGQPAPTRSVIGALPAPGRLLVSSPAGTWIVERNGGRRELGSYRGASWSPRGRFVVAWRGRELSALAPDGRVAWRLMALGPVREARWSPDGFRVAYRRDSALAVVAGDGSAPRLLDDRVASVAIAWRPGARRTLAWVDADDRVVVADVDRVAGARRFAAAVPGARELAWAPGGRQLLVLGGAGSALRLLDTQTERVRAIGLARGERAVAAAWAPAAHAPRLAVIVTRARSSRLLVSAIGRRLDDRPVFATSGRLTSVDWSPDASRLLVRWADADQWLFLPANGRGSIAAVSPVARRFRGAPTIRGWCCVARSPRAATAPPRRGAGAR